MSSILRTGQVVVSRDPTAAEIERFLASRSGSQMTQLMRSIQAPAAQVSLAKSMLLIPSTAHTKSAPPEKAKKALNAFVGFRCYYIHIPDLKPWPMKKLSNIMGVMWEADQNKSLWSLMAKAWSIIRDQVGKDKASLHHFFEIICPHLNMPTPETYLHSCGWTLSSDKDGNPTVSKKSFVSQVTVSTGIAGMALSVEDIITHCQDMGYAIGYVPDLETHSPTFLAQSHNHKSSSVVPQTQPANSVYDYRLAARNKRREKRQTSRDTSVLLALQQQIIDAHSTPGQDIVPHDDPVLSESEPMHFYQSLAGLLTDHDQQGFTDFSGDLIATGDAAMAGWTDYAFRIGADEDATLPMFDFANM
ncbi:MAT1-1-1 mating-type protein [Boeremia exigua]|uniref:MAT1-1-1 mating-type protein n=1 Tax=Boeremia exigua TaxID=749465 RepID=UPI001E8E4BFA|nr:MAT1-1-1 mating-type protein [Boeremia exigua]KAH6620149.1 MAT1-1-1 mating-type protein [Boeremia exigua]